MFSYMYNHPLLEESVKISYLYEYHAYYHFKGGVRVKNPNFNAIDGLILDLKKNSEHAINKFYNDLVSIFNHYESVNKIVFCAIPGHVAFSEISAIHIIAKYLSKHYGRPDYSEILQRYKTIPRLSDGGVRNVGVHINSIRVDPKYQIKGKRIILLDDISTSGSSMAASNQILKIAGAEKVTCLALAHKF